jgi:uncharacterized membrane protein
MSSRPNVSNLLSLFQARSKHPISFNEEGISKEYLEQSSKQSLAIKILSIIGGLLASLTFTTFLLITGIYDSAIGLCILGAIFIAASIIINKQYESIILDTVSVSSLIIGFVLFSLGLDKLHFSFDAICTTLIVLSALAVYLVRNYVLVFAALITINASIIMIIVSNDFFYLIHAYTIALTILTVFIFLNEAKLITTKRGNLYPPLRIALLLSLISILFIASNSNLLGFHIPYPFISSIVSIFAVLLIIKKVLTILGINNQSQKVLIYLSSAFALAVTTASPGISGTILLLMLTFCVGYKTGFVIAVTAFIYFIAQFYYDLSFTLLNKSMFLFVSGAILLIFYLFTHKKLTDDEKV